MTDEESDGGEVGPSTDELSAKGCTWSPAEERQQEVVEETSSFTTASGHVNVAALTTQHPGGREEEVVMAAAEVSAAVQVAGHHIKLRYKSCKGKKNTMSPSMPYFLNIHKCCNKCSCHAPHVKLQCSLLVIQVIPLTQHSY